MEQHECNCEHGTPEKKSEGRLAFILILILFLAVMGLAVWLIFGNKKDEFISMDQDSIVNMNGVILKMDEGVMGKEIYTFSSDNNANNSITAYKIGTTLYVMDSDFESVEVSEDVYSFIISYNGAFVAYTTADEEEATSEATLYLYDTQKDKSTKIDTDINGDNITISPNGRYVAYLKDFEGRSDNTLYFAGMKKEPVKIDKDGCYPLAISPDGKNLYYGDYSSSEGEYKLYHYNGKESKKIAKDVWSYYWFNKNVSEVIFSGEGGTYYYTPDMEESIEICKEPFSGCYNGPERVSLIKSYSGTTSRSAYLVDKKTLKEGLFYAGKSVYWLNEEGTESVKLSPWYQSVIAADGKSLIYVEDGQLYKIPKFGMSIERKNLYSGDEYLYYVISNDKLSQFYVITENGDLSYVKNSKKLETISEDFVYNGDNIAYNEAMGKICYIENNNLYSAGKKEKSKELIVEDCVGIFPYGDGVVFGAGDNAKTFYMEKKSPIIVYFKK